MTRLAVRDLRRPCAEEGREGGSTGGAEGDQSRPSTSAPSYSCVSLIILTFAKSCARLVTVLGGRPTIVLFAYAHPFAIPTLLGRCVAF